MSPFSLGGCTLDFAAIEFLEKNPYILSNPQILCRKFGYLRLFWFLSCSCLARYFSYLDWLETVDPLRLKFLDESHFVPKQLAKGNGHVWSVKGSRFYTRNNALAQARFVNLVLLFLVFNLSASVTLITSISPAQEVPIFIDYRVETNDQVTYYLFSLT